MRVIIFIKEEKKSEWLTMMMTPSPRQLERHSTFLARLIKVGHTPRAKPEARIWRGT